VNHVTELTETALTGSAIESILTISNLRWICLVTAHPHTHVCCKWINKPAQLNQKSHNVPLAQMNRHYFSCRLKCSTGRLACPTNLHEYCGSTRFYFLKVPLHFSLCFLEQPCSVCPTCSAIPSLQLWSAAGAMAASQVQLRWCHSLPACPTNLHEYCGSTRFYFLKVPLRFSLCFLEQPCSVYPTCSAMRDQVYSHDQLLGL